MEYEGTNQELKMFLESMNLYTVEEVDPETGRPVKMRELPGKLAYAFRKCRRELTPVAEDFDEERKAAATKFSRKGEDGKPLTKTVNGQDVFDVEDIEGFNQAYAELALKKEKVKLHLVPDSVIEEMKVIDEEALGLIAWIFEGELEKMVQKRKELEERQAKEAAEQPAAE